MKVGDAVMFASSGAVGEGDYRVDEIEKQMD
jgi:hypothetical protein